MLEAKTVELNQFTQPTAARMQPGPVLSYTLHLQERLDWAAARSGANRTKRLQS